LETQALLSKKNKVALIVAALLILVDACPTTCLAQSSVEQAGALRYARDFLKIAYPELSGRKLLLNINATQPIDEDWRRIDEMRFTVRLLDPLSEGILNPPFNAKSGQRLAPPNNPTLLQGSIKLDDSGKLIQLYLGDCDLANYKKNQALHAMVESHPEWLEPRAFEELKNLGAQFGPEAKEQLLSAVRARKYEKFIGKFDVDSAIFEGLAHRHEGDFALLHWTVQLRVREQKETVVIYTLLFEPFGGTLIAVTRQ
jgi:hypothetical protein